MKAVNLVLWDIILISEQYEGFLPEKDQIKIRNLLSFFRQNLMMSNKEIYVVLNKLIDVLSKLLNSSDKEKSYDLLKIVREFESII